MTDYERMDIPDDDPLKKQMPSIQAYNKGAVHILLSRDPITVCGKSGVTCHLSISREDRFPSWNEIKEARYRFMPRNKDVVMFLPPPDQYVNIHNNCFHLHELP